MTVKRVLFRTNKRQVLSNDLIGKMGVAISRDMFGGFDEMKGRNGEVLDLGGNGLSDDQYFMAKVKVALMVKHIHEDGNLQMYDVIEGGFFLC